MFGQRLCKCYLSLIMRSDLQLAWSFTATARHYELLLLLSTMEGLYDWIISYFKTIKFAACELKPIYTNNKYIM